MSIRCPTSSLRNVAHVPVVCPACGYAAAISEHDERFDEALVASTYLSSIRREVRLLERTEQLFKRFPTSQHPLKLKCEERRRGEPFQSQSDPEFEAAVRAEPDLFEFLSRPGHSFLLSARLPALRQSVAHLESNLDESLVQCPRCKPGRLVIERGFFQTL